jgi:hypothetical protein
VELAGSSSWRFGESSGDDLLHVALFVRDAVALPVPLGPAVPPPLLGMVPDHRHLLAEHERSDAGRHWAGWWTAVTGLHVRAPDKAPDQDLAALRARHERAGSPPDFAALGNRPLLHRAVVESFPEAHRWVNRPRRGAGAAPAPSFPYELIRQVAEDVAFDRSVDSGQVRASAVVLDVEGSWWHLLAPGTVICSVAAAAAPFTAQLLVRQAFESGLPR